MKRGDAIAPGTVDTNAFLVDQTLYRAQITGGGGPSKCNWMEKKILAFSYPLETRIFLYRICNLYNQTKLWGINKCYLLLILTFLLFDIITQKIKKKVSWKA